MANTESPPTGVCLYFPPACPQGSTTGADPGALQGLSEITRVKIYIKQYGLDLKSPNFIRTEDRHRIT